MTNLPEKMQQLYALTSEIKEIAPNINNNNLYYKNLFNNINDIVTNFEQIKTTDGIPEMHIVEIIVITEGTHNDYNDMLYDFDAQYPEFIADETKEKTEESLITDTISKFTTHFYGLWIGDKDDCARLTHHAEGLYGDTNLENTHVEVCIDGKWFGRN